MGGCRRLGVTRLCDRFKRVLNAETRRTQRYAEKIDFSLRLCAKIFCVAQSRKEREGEGKDKTENVRDFDRSWREVLDYRF